MTRRLLATYGVLAAFVLALVVLPLGLTSEGRAEERLLSDVERDARVLAGQIEEAVEAGAGAAVGDVVGRYADRTGGRVVVTDAAGVAIVDTGAPPGADPRVFGTRPEFAEALDGAQASGIRQSTTLDEELAFVAVPVVSGGTVAGAVRVTYPTASMRADVRGTWWRLLGLSVAVLGAALGLGWLVAQWVSGPVEALAASTRAVAQGDLSRRVAPDRGPPELRDLGEEFNRMAERIAALVAARQAFVADASHQLRTPLTALRLRLDGLEADLEAGDRGRAGAEVAAMARELDRLDALVGGLLTLARSEAPAADAVITDAAAVVRERVDSWRALATEHEVELVLEVPEGPTEVWFLPGGLEQVLDNLLDNALEVAPPRTEVAVEVRDRPGSAHVELEVRDLGPGLDAEDRARAPERFWRGAAAVPGGTGLGLAVVAELARASGAELVLGPRPDGRSGLVACLRLRPGGAPPPGRPGPATGGR